MAASRKQAEPSSKSVSATQEHCFFCFDSLIMHLKSANTADLSTVASFPNADNLNTVACVGWNDATAIKGLCISFQNDEDLASQLEDRANKSGKSIYTALEVQGLTCTVYFVKRDAIVQAKSIDDWELNTHGINVQFADFRTGKQFTRAYLPQTITKRGWNKRQAVEHAMRRAGYDGPITNDLLASVTLSRFTVHSSASASFAEYRAGYAALVHGERTAGAAGTANVSSKPLLELRAKLFDYLDQEKARKVTLKGKREGSRKFSYTLGGILAVVLVGLIVLLRYQQSYSVFYEEFLENYDVLGVAREAPLPEVKKAHREMSLRWHPDKNPGCAECGPKYARIAEAYKQITDREKGTLKFKDQPQQRPRQE